VCACSDGVRRGGGGEGRKVRGHDAIRLRYVTVAGWVLESPMGGRCVLGSGQAWAASCRWKAVAGRVRAADGCRRRFVAVVVVVGVVVVVSKGAGARRRAAESNVISAEGGSGDDSWASDAGRASLAGAPMKGAAVWMAGYCIASH
jgi:hypothetical protein